MDTFNKSQRARVGDAACDLVNESKKWANEVYEDGMNRVNQAEQEFKVYSDELLFKVQKNPLAAILIAGGVGFILAKLMSK